MTRVCGKLRPLLDGCRGNRDCWDSVAKGETIQESAMRLPTDAEGADTNYRDRLIALLHVPPLPSGLISPDVSRMSADAGQQSQEQLLQLVDQYYRGKWGRSTACRDHGGG